VDDMTLLAVGMIFMFFAGLTSVGIFYTDKTWLKAVLAVLLNLIVVILLRFSSWFVHISYPAETELVNTLDHFYGWGVKMLWVTTAVVLIYITAMIVQTMTDRKRKKIEQRWE